MANPFRLLLRRCVLLAAILIFSSPPAFAQRRERAIPVPPQPIQQAVRAKRSEPLEIPLRIYGKQAETLTFLIRAAPQHGKLGTPRSLEKDLAAVTYEPPEDLAITADRFSYAVQSSAGVSGAVEVFITIVDAPPRLILPAPIDFPTLLAGTTAQAPFELVNRGGGRAEGEVQTDPPWRLASDPKYRLGAGEKKEFKLVFAPPEGGTFSGELRFSSQPERITALSGKAEPPLAATPARLELRHSPSDPLRSGSFELSNQTTEPLTVQLTSSPRLQHPSSLELEARGRSSVSVRIAATDVAALESEICVEAPGFALRVPVRAAVVGPILRAGSETISFGQLPARRAASARLELRNLGGSPGFVALEIPPPFQLGEPSANVLPGEAKQLTILLPENTPPGRHRTWLKVKGEQQSFELLVDAEIVAQTPARPSTRTRGKIASASSGAPATEEPGETEPAPAARFSSETHADYQLPRGVQVGRLEPTRATLVWPATLHPATAFRLERRVLSLGKERALQVGWAEMRPRSLQRTGERWVAELSGLPAGQIHVIRVLPALPSGDSPARLFAIEFHTPRATTWREVLTLPRLLLAGLLACLALLLWQRRRQRVGRIAQK